MNRYSVDIRYAHDIVGRFDSQRDLALRGELPETMAYLEQLQFPLGQPSPFTGSLSNFVEPQRRRAVDDNIVYLRAKTGKNLADKPEARIQESGNKAVSQAG